MKKFDTFKPSHILCPIDFSELSDLALKYAAVGARTFNAKLTIMHAETFELPRYFSRTQTDALIDQLRVAKKEVERELIERVKGLLGDFVEKLDLEYTVVEANPSEAILDFSEKNPIELIVLGTHGYSGLKRFLLGSVAQRIVENGKAPVFLIRQKEHEFIDVNQLDAIPRLERILCPCNITEAAETTLKYAVSLSKSFNSKLTVLYSHENDQETDFAEIEREMDKRIKKNVGKDFDFELVIRKGVAAKQIIQYAREKKHDLIILAARYQSIEKGIFYGRTTDLVVKNGSVPVLVTPYFT